MSFKLEILDYQETAIKSIVSVFKGSVKNTFDNATNDGVRANVCNLNNSELRHNINTIIKENAINEENARLSDDNDLTIEMETGTGKTLVYLKSIYELIKHYEFTKFIILVPSVAIREGILSAFDDFKTQLYELYGFTPKLFEYNSKKLNNVTKFIEEQHPQIMVLTLASFNSEDKILNQEQREDLFDGSTAFIKGIAQTNPIIFMDEPQVGMDTANSIKQIAKLNPMYKIRFSATHKITKNLIYRLTPYDSYKQGLVKKIEVFTVSEKNDEATLKIELKSITNGNGKPKATLKLWKLKAGKYVFDVVKGLKDGDNLAEKTNNPSYSNYTIQRVNKSLKSGKWYIRFFNGVEVLENTKSNNIQDIWNLQMEWLLHRHFSKFIKLKEQGIKALSLVFIDRVNNYMGENPLIKELFEKKYKDIYPEYFDGVEPTFEQIEAVQGYYFASTKKGEFTDNESSIRKNKDIFELILKQKQELLKLDNPVQIIFSHSALGVGWDNPNIFNIATLSNTFSEIKKRQEIGRGLRICVNQNGERIYDNENATDDERINNLTVIPNETYETFVAQYQSEINETYGNKKAGAKLSHTHKGEPQNKVSFKLNKKETVQQAFRRLWKKLARKTEFSVYFDEKSLIRNAIEEVNKIEINDYVVEVSSRTISAISENEVIANFGGSETYKVKGNFSTLDLYKEISENSGISYTTTLNILKEITNVDQAIKNPPIYIQKAVAIIRNAELEEMFRGLEYKMTDEIIPLNLEDFEKQVVDLTNIVETPNKGVYDKMIVDSDIERRFALSSDNITNEEVVSFIKLPSYYKIETPIGTYNPDFGIVLKRKRLKNNKEEEYHFIVEIKGTDDLNNKKALKESEVYKIKCAIKHFKSIGMEAYYKAPINTYDTFRKEAEKTINKETEKI